MKEAAVADSPRETLALARTAAGAVRSLNHATLGSGGLAQPADAYELIGELSLAAAGLPQLLAQVGRWLASALEAGRLGCDDGADPGAAVGGARLSLSGARASAAALARDLGQAQQQLAAVHGGPRRRRRRRRKLMIDAVVTKFGLARMPFGRDLPPSRLHRHRDCGEAAARIAWAVADKTIGMVTGEVGTGKTVAIRAAVADLDPASHTVIYVGNPSTGVRGILAHVVTALGGKPVHGTAALAVQAWNVLAGEAAERGRTPVLVIDEAHLLDHDQLESIRLMTNHDMDSSTPFATILVGQPTLRHSVKLGVLAALEQRITVRYQMKGMTPDETAGYIRHHLEQAGRTAELFTDEAIAQIHQAARGKPRTVNNICTAALIATAGAGKNLVDHASARAAIAEVTATD